MKKMLSIILSMVILLLPLTVVSVSAESLSEGFYTYSIVDGNAVIIDVSNDITGDITVPSTLGGYTVKHIGVSAFSFRSDITSISLPDTIETIGASAFTYCDFKTFTMPDSVVSVGDNAFDSCDKLESIYISKNVTHLGEHAFYACRKLNEINIPKSLVSIGRASFFYCDNLTSINVDKNNANYSSVDGVLFNKQQTKLLQYPAGKTNTAYAIPNTVTAVGEHAFFEAGKLKSINIPNSVNKLEYAAFSWCYNLTDIVVPNSVTEIEGSAFSGCTRLKSIKLPDGITTIVDGLFYECRGFTEFEIPSTVTTIGAAAFAECDELNEIVIPDSVTYVGDRAFESSGIKSIYIPASVKSLGEEIFYDCWQLENINIDQNNANYCSVDGVMFNKSKTKLMYYPAGSSNETYTIPNSVSTINEWAFFNCYDIKQVNMPQNLEKIGSYAFAMCSNLDNITLPDSVISIGEFVFENTAYARDKNNWEDNVLYINNHLIRTDSSKLSGDYTIKDGTRTIAERAFYACYYLESVTIPDSVKSIGANAFGKCYSLTSVSIPQSVTYIGETVFEECDKLTLCVYEDSYAKDYAVTNEIPYVEIKLIKLENNGVKLHAHEDVIPEDTLLEVLVSELPDNINEKNIVTYDISLEKDEEAIQPNGLVTIYLPVSENIDVNKCGVGYIDSDGNMIKIGARYKDGYMMFTTDKLGTYAIFEKNYISGDVNADNSINNKDLGLLMQYLNNWEVEVACSAADVNADGTVNNKDYGLLMQYINNWDVLLK